MWPFYTVCFFYHFLWMLAIQGGSLHQDEWHGGCSTHNITHLIRRHLRVCKMLLACKHIYRCWIWFANRVLQAIFACLKLPSGVQCYTASRRFKILLIEFPSNGDSFYCHWTAIRKIKYQIDGGCIRYDFLCEWWCIAGGHLNTTRLVDAHIVCEIMSWTTFIDFG